MKKYSIHIGLFLTLLFLFIHLVIIDDYGITWDFHHHFFAGLTRLGRPITKELTRHIPFTEPSPLLTNDLPFGPLMSIAPVLTYQLFYENLKVLSFDNAYNLAVVVSGVAGMGILFFFLLEAFNLQTATIGFVFLALLPRYFGDLHNNMKDVPQSAAFTLAIWMFWRLVRYKRLKDLLIASLAFAIAFNTKVNTIAVPMIGLVWLFFLKFRITYHVSRITLFYFLLAPLFALILWIPFWNDPFGVLFYIPKFFQINTQNIEVLLNGQWYCSGSNVPWYYPLWYLAITTPLPTLLFFLIGLIGLISPIGLIKKPLASLLLLWFFVPLVRYLYPKMGVIDGIRHFEEVVYPLSAIAAIGTVTMGRWAKRWFPQSIIRLIGLIGLISLIWNLIVYHPYQISYYNELVGGIRGAYGKYDIDYWGGPQKQAIAWINQKAPIGSKVSVAMAADAAAKYLRPDLLPYINTTDYPTSDFVVILNRQSFFYRYRAATNFMLTHTPAYVIQNQGIPIVWIYDNRTPNRLDKPLDPWWSGKDPCIVWSPS